MSSGGGKVEYTECYKVLYCAGEMKRAGSRVWQDGLLTHYTANQRTTLRDSKGVLLDEAFYAHFPRAHPPPAVKEEDGVRQASIATATPFQINTSYTVEVERVKFVHERPITALRETTPQQRRTRPMPEYFKNVPDILQPATTTPDDGKRASMAGQKRSADDGTTSPAQRTQTARNLSTTPPRRFPAVGLSKTPRRF